MALYFIGIGLNDEKDISLKGLEVIRKSKYVFLENYTSVLGCSVKVLEKLYRKKVVLADREMVEKRAEVILNKAERFDTAFLVVGDPLAATTHVDLMLRAKSKGIKVKIIHNASILSAVGVAGLQLYKFGRVASIPFFEEFWEVESPYNILLKNDKVGLHTLFLLDLNPAEERFMIVNKAIEVLLKIEGKKKKKVFTKKRLCIGCARLGSLEPVIKVGEAGKLLKEDFGKPPHCLIVPSKKLHFMEEEVLKQWLA